MSQNDKNNPIAEAYGLACNFQQALEDLSEDYAELTPYAEAVNEIVLSIGRMWSDSE